MGGNREHHRCVMRLLQQGGDGDAERDDDDNNAAAQQRRGPAVGLTMPRNYTTTTTTTSIITTTTSHVTSSFCPVTIHIEECSDTEENGGGESDATCCAKKNDINEMWTTAARDSRPRGLPAAVGAVVGKLGTNHVSETDEQQRGFLAPRTFQQTGGNNSNVVGGTASPSLSPSSLSSSSSSLLLSVPGQPPPRMSTSQSSARQLSSPSSSPSLSSSSSSSNNDNNNSNNFLEVPPMVVECSELSALKATAVRLKLRTRSSSFLEWQARWLHHDPSPPQFPVTETAADEGSGGAGGVDVGEGEGGGGDGLTNRERRERINEALDWLKSELKEMRSMDQHLARQLLSLRHDIHQLRLSRSCQEHRDLLDDVQSELEEQEEMSDVLDLPNDLTLNDTPLKQIGVTRMNISTRRFSMC